MCDRSRGLDLRGREGRMGEIRLKQIQRGPSELIKRLESF